MTFLKLFQIHRVDRIRDNIINEIAEDLSRIDSDGVSVYLRTKNLSRPEMAQIAFLVGVRAGLDNDVNRDGSYKVIE